MGRDDWLLGGDRREAGADRIYAAATDLVVRDGLDALDVDALAAKLHCSRATVYRHAGGKRHIRDAVLTRMAARVVDTVQHAVEGLTGSDRVLTAIRVALVQLRSDPMRRLLMTSNTAREMSQLHTSTMLKRIAADLTGIAEDDRHAALWVVHVVLSLIYFPLADEQTEHEILRRFVSPGFE